MVSVVARFASGGLGDVFEAFFRWQRRAFGRNRKAPEPGSASEQAFVSAGLASAYQCAEGDRRQRSLRPIKVLPAPLVTKPVTTSGICLAPVNPGRAGWPFPWSGDRAPNAPPAMAWARVISVRGKIPAAAMGVSHGARLAVKIPAGVAAGDAGAAQRPVGVQARWRSCRRPVRRDRREASRR